MKKRLNFILLLMQITAVVCNLLVVLIPQLRSQTVFHLVILLGYGCGVALGIRLLSQRKDP